jgi:hypothetical protein
MYFIRLHPVLILLNRTISSLKGELFYFDYCRQKELTLYNDTNILFTNAQRKGMAYRSNIDGGGFLLA